MSGVVHTVTRTYKDQSSASLSKVESVPGDKENNLSKSVAIGTNVQLDFKCTVAKLKSIAIQGSTAIDIYTNDVSGGAPQEHIAIAAGQCYIWTLAIDGAGKVPFAGNVTTIYVTNAALCLFEIRACESA